VELQRRSEHVILTEVDIKKLRRYQKNRALRVHVDFWLFLFGESIMQDYVSVTRIFVVAASLAISGTVSAVVQFDQDVTPTILFGAGNNNGAFTTDRASGVEVGLRAKLRYDENGQPQNEFRSNGDGTYTFFTRSRPDFPDGPRGEWSFEWSVNTDYDGSTFDNLNDLTYEIGLDGDPGPGTDFLVFDPITPTVDVPFWDHAIGDNASPNGGGAVATDGPSYQGLLSDNNVAQNSWQYGFGFIANPTGYDPRLPGTYTIYLQASNAGGVIARSEIDVIVVDPELEFDQTITPAYINGSGNADDGFTTDRRNDIELAIRAKLRYDENGQPQNEFRSNGDGSYTFFTRSRPDFPDGQRGEWAFDWGVNSNYNGGPGPNLDAYTFELGLDGDPGPGTNFLTFDPITPSAGTPCFDHAFGDNTTPNGGGTVLDCAAAGADVAYADALANNSVAHQSWQYGFFAVDELADYDPRVPGTYSIYLTAFDADGIEVARTEITVEVVDPPLAFDQDVTPDAIFGGGNANGAFTTDRRNDIELGLRGKLRFNAMGQAENTFNSNGDGTYSFQPGLISGGSALRAEWSFEWSVNTNYQGGPGPNIDGYTYELGLDGDPSLGTDFLVFDPITPTTEVPFWDHSIGDNTTGNGAGVEATDAATYQTLIGDNNVAQQSWRYEFFPQGPIADFDPTVDGNYRIYLVAFNAEGIEVARSDIEILVGGAQSGTLADVELAKSTTSIGTQFVGDSIQYVLEVSNTDLALATNVMIEDVLPDNLDFVAGSCDDGTAASAAGQTVTFPIGDLPSGETVTCTLDTVVSASGVIVNTAAVSADNDADATNNDATVRLLGVIESVGLTGDVPTPTDNDYTRINDVVQAAAPGDVIVLRGTFDWNESNAFNAWSLGSDGVSGNLDDWTIYVPDGLSDLTLTALVKGDATIQGPGDLPGVDLEGFLLVFGTNPGLQVSNLVINDFDVALGIYYAGGGLNVYDDLTLVDNHISMASDIAGSSAAGEAFQNIGIHYAFGDNILIARNVIEIPGDAESTPSLRAASVAMQSNTSINAYEGLVIEDNEVRVLFAQADNPERITGIWENGNSHTSNIAVRNNRFVNLDPGNDPSLNAQQGFRLTSHSSAMSTMRFEGNHVEGANVGYAWLSFDSFGADFTDEAPIEFVANTAVGNATGVLLDSNGAANFSCNRFYGNDLGVSNITQSGRVSLADNNWWGCNAGPNAGNCDGFDIGLTADRWLVAELTAASTILQTTALTDVTLDVRGNSDGSIVTDCSLPGTPVTLAATLGSVTPTATDTVGGAAPALYTAPSAPGVDTLTGTIDGETVTLDITVEQEADVLFRDSFEG